MFCYKHKFLSSLKYNIFMLKDEIQLSHENEIEIIKLNSFHPRFKWTKCDISGISQFELMDDQKSRIYKIDSTMGQLLKEFLNGKVCFQGINNQFKIAKIISKDNSGSIVRMRYIHNEELVFGKIYKQGKPEFEQEFRNEVLALQILKHKNIQKIREYYIEANHNYIIYDVVEGTPLDECIINDMLDDQQIIHIMKQLVQVVYFIQQEGFSHQNIKLDNIYYCSLINQITLVNFGKSALRNRSISPGDSYFSKTTKDYSDLNTCTSRFNALDKDFFECGLVFIQLITRKIINFKDIIHAYGDKGVFNLITDIHNKKTSILIMKLLQQNKASDKSNFSESLLSNIDDLNQELINLNYL